MSDDDPPSRREKADCHHDDDEVPRPSSPSSPWEDTWPPAALAMAKQALLLTSQGWPLTGQDQDAPDEPGSTGHPPRRRDVTAIDVSDVLGPSHSPSAVRHPSIAQSGLAAATVEIAERMVSLLLMRIVALVTWRLEREEEEEEEEEEGVEEGEMEDEIQAEAASETANETKQPIPQQKQQRRRRKKKKKKKRMYSDLSTTTIAKTALLGHACNSNHRNSDKEDSNNNYNNNNNHSMNYDDRETTSYDMVPPPMLSPLQRHSSEPGFLSSNILPSTISFQTHSSRIHSHSIPSHPSDDPLTLRRPPPQKTRQPPRWPTRITPLLVSQLRQYVLVICENYRTVPYHNVEHAYHVFLSANKLLDLLLREDREEKGGDAPSQTGRRAGPTFGIKSDPLVQLAFLFSALVHDVDHRGISNRQLVLESDDLAILYNDQSVAEQRSLAVAFAVWMMPEYGVLRGVLFDEETKGKEEKEGKGETKTKKKNDNNNNREEHFKFRKLVIDLVLVTDIASPERTQIVKSKWKEAFGEVILTANLNHRKGTRRGGSGVVGGVGGGSDRDRDKERNREKETTENRIERERNEIQIDRRKEHGEADAAATATANNTANNTAAKAAALVAAEFFASSEEGIPSESNRGERHRPASAPPLPTSSAPIAATHGSQPQTRKGGAMAVAAIAVPATATTTTTATSTAQMIQKHSNANNNIKRGGMSSSSSSSSTGRGGGGAMQKQGSFTRRGRGMPKQLQKQGSIKNLELMSTLDEDDDGDDDNDNDDDDDDDDDALSVKSFNDLDLGAKAAKYLNGNHYNNNNNNDDTNNNNCNINTLKAKWMPSKQPPPQRGISRRHSLSSKIGTTSSSAATERKKKRRPRPESQPLRDSFLSVADSVADSVIESVLHSVDLSSGSSYSSEEGDYSLEDQFDTSFVSRQKMNFDDDGGGMSIDSRAFSLVCCNDGGDNNDDDDDDHDDIEINDDLPARSSPPSIPPKDTSDDTIPTNVRLNPTPPMTSISTEEKPTNKRTGPKLIQSLSAGDLEAMMDDRPTDSVTDKFRPTFRPPRLAPNRHDRRNTDEGLRPLLRRPPNRHRFLSRSMISPGEFKRSTPRAHSQERRLGVRRALDLAGSTIEAFKSSYQSGHSSDMEYLLDDDPDEVDELKATVVLEQMMRAADVAALLQDWENVMKWSTRLYKELKNGYLAERGEDPSVGWFDNQIKFFDFYILPLAKNLGLTGVFEEEVADCFVQCVKNNLARWIEEGERETDLMMKLDEQERRSSVEGERISSHGSCEDDAGHSKEGRTIRRSSQADEYIASDLASSMYSLNSGLANSVHNNSGDLEADIALYSASSADKKHSARNAVNGGDKNSWR